VRASPPEKGKGGELLTPLAVADVGPYFFLAAFFLAVFLAAFLFAGILSSPLSLPRLAIRRRSAVSARETVTTKP
jgi:hypothetical protein